jgi:mono/diheme cytochrome c family protein
MKSHSRPKSLITVVMLIALLWSACGKETDHHHDREEHGTPKDWKFSLAKGNPDEGRKIFVELECYKCHEVKGERFPDVASGEKGVGPELSHMAGMHPVEFFAESIVNPNAVIDDDAKERGYVGADGRSKMPEYGDVLTVKQLTDLATYLTTLGGGGGHRSGH